MGLEREDLIPFLEKHYKKEILFAEKYEEQAKGEKGEVREVLLGIAHEEREHAGIVREIISKIETDVHFKNAGKDLENER